MSYVVTIRRDSPISADDLRDLVKSDETLCTLLDSSNRITGILWRAANDAKTPMTFDNGVLWSTPRTDAELAKMGELAAKLGSRLIGEEGEDLTLPSRTLKAGTGCAGKAAGILLLILVLAAIAALA